MTLACTNFDTILSSDFQDHLVAVEFECGGLLKKAQGILTCIAPDFIRLERSGDNGGGFVKVTIFFGTDCPIVECASAIVIKKCKICAVELCPDVGTCPPPLFGTVCPTITAPF